jgi:hypothetical protein
MTVDWGALLVGQLAFYWDVHLRPRLEGLTDEEYFWEPVEGCWSLRPTENGTYALDSQFTVARTIPVTAGNHRLAYSPCRGDVPGQPGQCVLRRQRG